MRMGDDRVAFIAGASTGLGEAFAYALAERGIGYIILSARRRELLDQVAATIHKK